MRFWNRHWYSMGIAVAAVTFVILIANWGNIPVLQRIQMISFMAMLVHQFEEYGFPGGEPAIMNIALQGSRKPDRYPLNQFSAMLTNCLFSYVIYLLPVFFYNVIWLGIAPILMGVMQFGVHGIMTNRKLKSIYNPGLGAVCCIHIPVAVYYIWYITANNLTTSGTWIMGIFYTLAATVLVLGVLTYIVLPNENTKWVFDPEEMQRFHVQEKLAEKGINVEESPMGDILKKIKK